MHEFFESTRTGAFFEEKGGIDGLLDAIHKAAMRDTVISQGSALNERNSTLLQALEILTQDKEMTKLPAKTIRQKVSLLLNLPEDQLGSAQWVGHSLKQLHLTDAARKRNPGDGIVYQIVRAEVLDMMKRYQVQLIEK